LAFTWEHFLRGYVRVWNPSNVVYFVFEGEMDLGGGKEYRFGFEGMCLI